MRILLAVHGFPPELRGGTEHATQALARELVRGGHEVVVVSGALEAGPARPPLEELQDVPGAAAPLRVLRIRRQGEFPGHWQRARDDEIGAVFDELVRELRPDVLHVQHWLRLSRDLVARAARAGVPSVVTLHDAWTTCLAYFRVRPDSHASCDRPLGPADCLDCVGFYPRDDRTGALRQLDEHRRDVVRELHLARVVFTLCREQIPRVRAALAPDLDGVELVPLPPARELASFERRDSSVTPPLPPPAELGRLVLGSWGAYYPLKGQALLCDAVERLLARGVRVELHLAGTDADPAYGDEVRRRAAALAPAVVAHGRFAEGTLARHPASRVHAFVSGSIVRETWGFVLDEAIALGLPVVIPRAGAFPEHVPRGLGAVHYAMGDADDLADALERLAREPGELGRLRAELPPIERLLPSVAAHAERVLDAYRTAVRAGAPPVEPEPPDVLARVADDRERFLQAVRLPGPSGIPGAR